VNRFPRLLFVLICAAVTACGLTSSPPSTDAGADPEISTCCYKLWQPGEARKCLLSYTEPGQCRWLSCLGGLWETMVCRPED